RGTSGIDFFGLFLLLGMVLVIPVGIIGWATIISEEPPLLILGMIVFATAIVWSMIRFKKRDDGTAAREFAIAVLVSAGATVLAFAAFYAGMYALFSGLD